MGNCGTKEESAVASAHAQGKKGNSNKERTKLGFLLFFPWF